MITLLSGDPAAHLALAQCYTHGRGLAQSYEKAFEHNKRACELGEAPPKKDMGGQVMAPTQDIRLAPTTSGVTTLQAKGLSRVLRKPQSSSPMLQRWGLHQHR